MSDAISTQGTKLYVSLSAVSPPSYSLIPEVRNIGGPNEKADKIDVTHLGSTGGRREYIQGFKTNDDCAVLMNYLPGNTIQQQFLALYDSGDILPAKVEYPDGATVLFDFFLNGRERPVAVGDALQITVSMSITGNVDFVDAP